MPAFSYKTIQQPTDSIYKEKGSRFLGFAFPVTSEAEIKSTLEVLKKKYFDARHHCYGWMLGPEKNQFRAFDGGEPNHSAGDPILGQIRSKDLTNILIVVVRYFGGTKLGVGGLTSAYRIAASAALNMAIIIEKEVMEKMTLHYHYEATPEIMKLIKDFELNITYQSYAESCVIELDYKIRIKEPLMGKISLMKALGMDINVQP
jgi:uncharacterized YigZ family protein